ncbi:hypothetical protein M3Y99_01644100 [Aphelenchoides fujianensis]|nr:hypothetical protein M3Y99_01644100 [Aphelenchoides fujianensis]
MANNKSKKKGNPEVKRKATARLLAKATTPPPRRAKLVAQSKIETKALKPGPSKPGPSKEKEPKPEQPKSPPKSPRKSAPKKKTPSKYKKARMSASQGKSGRRDAAGSNASKKPIAASDNPAFLPDGIPVSAKFKGAYCEADVQGFDNEAVEIRVEAKSPTIPVNKVFSRTEVQGKLLVGQAVNVAYERFFYPAVIVHIRDNSTYKIMFNDGDERVLRRNQMVLKGGKHYDTQMNLDNLPLLNPDRYGKTGEEGVQGYTRLSNRFLKNKLGTQKVEAQKDETLNWSSLSDLSSTDGEEGDDVEADGQRGDQRAGGSGDQTAKPEQEGGSRNNNTEGDGPTAKKRRENAERGDSPNIEFAEGTAVIARQTSSERPKTTLFFGVVVARSAFLANSADKGRLFAAYEYPVRCVPKGDYHVFSAHQLSEFDESTGAETSSARTKEAAAVLKDYKSKGRLPKDWTTKSVFGSPPPAPSAALPVPPPTSAPPRPLRNGRPVHKRNAKRREKFYSQLATYYAKIDFKPEDGLDPVYGKSKLPLCVLYFAVERAGGYRKVSETETWPNVLSALGWGVHMDSEELRDLYHARLETFEYFQTKMKPNHQNRKGPLNFPAGSKPSAEGGEQKASRPISKRRLANMTAEAGEPTAGPSGLPAVQRQKSVSESKSGESTSKSSSQTVDAHRDASQPAERSGQKKPEEVALGSSGGKSARARAGTPSSVAEKDGCVPADIINVMHAEMAARESDTELYRVRLDNLRRPPSKMILRVLTKLVREVDNTPNFRFTKSVHREALDKLGRMTSAFIHYHGWNSRHDEWATLDRLKVSTETKRKSMLSFIRNYNIPSNVLEAVHSFYRRQALKAAKSSHANSADGERAKKTKPSEPTDLLKPQDLTPELQKFLFDDEGYDVPEPLPNMEFKAHRTTSTPEVNVSAEAGDRERSVRPSSKKSKTPDQNASSRAAVRGRKRSAKPFADATTSGSSPQPADVFDYFERESDDQSGAPKSKRRSKDPNVAAKSSRPDASSTSAASGAAPPESTPTKLPRPKKKRSSGEVEEKPVKEPAPTAAAPVFPITSAPSIQSSYKIPRLGDSATFKRSAEPAVGQPSTSKEVPAQPSLPTPEQPLQAEPTSTKKLERQASVHSQSVDTPAEISKKRRLSWQSRTESISRPSPPKTPKTTVEHPAAVQKTPAISPQRSPAPVHEATPAHANVAVSFFATDDAEAAGTSVRAMGSPLLTTATFKPIAVDTTVGGLPSEQPSGSSQSTATLPVASPAAVEAASPVAKVAPPQKSAELFNRKQHLLKFCTTTPWAQTAKPPKDLAAQFEVDDSDPKTAAPKKVPAAFDLKDVRSSISRVASMKPLNVDTHTTPKPSTSGLSTPAASLAVGSGAQLVATQSPAQASTAPNGHVHPPATAQMSAHLGDAKNIANPPLQHAIAAILNTQASPFVHAPSPNLQTGVNGHVPLISTNLDQFRLMAELAARQQFQSAPVPWYSVGMADGGEYNRRMAATAIQLFLNANPQSNLHHMLATQNGLPQPFPGYIASQAMPSAMDAPERKYAEMVRGMQQQFQPSTSNGHPPQNAAFPSLFANSGQPLWSPNVSMWPDSLQPRAPINPMAGSSTASGGTPADTRTFEQWALPKNAKAGSGVVPLPVKAKATVVAVENEAPCEDCGAKTSVAEMNELNLLPAFLRTRILDDFARSNRMTKERKNRPQLDTKGLSKPARRAVIERRRRDDELEELRKANGHDFLLLPVPPKDDKRRYRTFEPPRLLDVMASVGYDQNDARRLDESKSIADEAEQNAEEMDVKEMRAEILREMQARQAAKNPPTQLDTQDLGSLSAYINNLALMGERERARLVMANYDLEMSEQFEQTLQTTQDNIDVEQKAFKAEQTHYAKLSAKLNRHRPKILGQRSRKGYF